MNRALLGTLALVACAPLAAAAAGSAPPALYSNTQAASGAKLYAGKCEQCHGTRLEGGAGPALSGVNMTTLGVKTHLTVGEMFGYITTNMPMNEPASLTHDQYVAVMAYILKQNGYPAAGKPMTYAVASSSKALVRSYK